MGNSIEHHRGRDLFAGSMVSPVSIFQMRSDISNRAMSHRVVPTGGYFSNHGSNQHTMSLGSLQNIKQSHKLRAKALDVDTESLKYRQKKEKFTFKGWEDEVKFDPYGREYEVRREILEEP